MYKYMAGELKDRQLDAERLLFKPETIPEEVAKYRPPVDLEELLDGVTLTRLNDIFRAVLRRQEDKIDPVRSKFSQIQKEPFRVADKIVEILNLAADQRQLSFREFLKAQSSRVELVVAFLAVLELMKMGSVTLREMDGEEEDFLLEASEELIKDRERLAEELTASIDG